MIITKTPYRISLFGGGTDYPDWFERYGGAVLGASIDKYCYIACRYLPPFFEHRYRIAYSLIETVNNIDDIKHPAVREAIRYTKETRGLAISHDGDLPAHSGIGSSSSFTVGLLHALYALGGKAVSKRQLANEAIYVEREMAQDVVGYQDQILTAYGGFNYVKFLPDYSHQLTRIDLPYSRLDELQRHLMLFYTGINRLSSTVAASYIKLMDERKSEMQRTYELVQIARDILLGEGPLTELGRMLHESWLLKCKRGIGISTEFIDSIYSKARNAGALGGKITGAGGAGFMLLFAPPDTHESIKTALSGLLNIPFQFESQGTQVIHSSNEEIIYEPHCRHSGR